MKRILRNVFIFVAGLLIALLIIGLLLPQTWSVERSIYIVAKPQEIYPLVANLKEGWPQWSAFDSQDPEAQYSYQGPIEGVGASRTWISKMGGGTQTITQASPDSGIVYLLEMPSYNTRLEGVIKFEPRGALTFVKWTDHGDVGTNLLKRYMVFFIDNMIGDTMMTSLKSLKTRVEMGPE